MRGSGQKVLFLSVLICCILLANGEGTPPPVAAVNPLTCAKNLLFNNVCVTSCPLDSTKGTTADVNGNFVCTCNQYYISTGTACVCSGWFFNNVCVN